MLWMKTTATETTTDASSADEIQMDTNGDGVVDESRYTNTSRNNRNNW